LKIIIVAAYNTGKFSPFVLEQAESLRRLGIEIEYFGIIGKGICGYLRNRKRLIKAIKEFSPDLIHAHYGLSGLFANLQRKIPVITTFHGSDIHSCGYLLFLSKLCMRLSVYNIFVSKRLFNIADYKNRNYDIISCGVDVSCFYPMFKHEARKQLNWTDDGKYILFSGSFQNKIKNSMLAKRAVDIVGNCNLIELKGYTRKEVNLRMNACNMLLMTSYREASPMVIKEAMACNKPIVTVKVGDVEEVIDNTLGCFICTTYSPPEIAVNINRALDFKGDTTGRERIFQLKLSLEEVAERIKLIYDDILNP
jgi:glycosyltransferase involved in cell wall biosynthesis